MTRKIKSYHDRGAMFGCAGDEWWIEPAMFENVPASSTAPDDAPAFTPISSDVPTVSEDQLGMF